MRKLVLMSGSPGSGKSTWIKENDLESWTLSPDNIRLMFQSPIQTIEGNLAISPSNDQRVWALLFELLEQRMARGEFTVIDATHATTESINAYRKLAKEYRYRVYVVNFRDIPIETTLIRNKSRHSIKQVPENVIYQFYARIDEMQMPSWVTEVSRDNCLYTIFNTEPRDLNSYDKIYVVGDIHGCNAPLTNFLHTVTNKDLIIFTGDYLDRGIQNKEVLSLLIDLNESKYYNTIFLVGNHDVHLHNYALGNVEDIRSKEFVNETLPAIKDIPIKRVRSLTSSFQQIVYFTFEGKTYLVNHAGISNFVPKLDLIATEHFIRGVGNYTDNIDEIWTENMNKLPEEERIIQIHGHRNLYALPIQATEYSYNLEGKVDFGGDLRVLLIGSGHAITSKYFPNPIYKKGMPKQRIHTTESNEMASMVELVSRLRSHKGIKENTFGNISSFNFTRDVFRKKDWDELTIKARGLFIDTTTGGIVARGYEKFFNIDERADTKLGYLDRTLTFPVDVYKKENGYLGLIGYDASTDSLFYASKSSAVSDHATWLRTLFVQRYGSVTDKIKEYLKTNNSCLVFEVVLPQLDPHIIKYDKDEIYLLDIVDRAIDFNKKPYDEVVSFAKTYNLPYKEKTITIDNFANFLAWYTDVIKNDPKHEGFVIEDTAGYMVKIKLPYYNLWKRMRAAKDAIKGARKTNMFSNDAFTASVVNFMKKLSPDDLNKSIIEVRDMFEKYQANRSSSGVKE